MINRDLIEIFSDLARDKNVERSELGTILEQLFLYIIERTYGDASNYSVIVNIDKGEIEIYAEKTVVKVVEDPLHQITVEDALLKEPDLEEISPGDPFVEVIDPSVFGRRMIAHAKQFFSQRIQDIERQYIYEDYANRIGEIVIGEIRQIQRDNLFLNIGFAELRLPKKEQIPSENYRRKDTVRAVIKSVENTPKGPDIVVSRSDNHFLFKLFEMEVPEIEDGLIEIQSISRYPGVRSKIIVYSHDRRIDAVGACVGMRGSRIQGIVRELNNEKVDIVNYSEKTEVLISRALSPAKPMNLYIDDERKYCEAIFKDDELDLAIGRGGMNIKLASQLINYRIDAFGEKEYEQRKIEQNTLLVEIPNFPKKPAKSLQAEGVNTISEFQAKDEDSLLEVKEITENVLEKIYDSIQDFIEKNRSDDEADDDNPDDIDVPKPEAVEDDSAIKPDVKEKTLIPQSKEAGNIS